MNHSPEHAAHPIFVAHRGASERFPENTLVAYEAAVQAGAKYVELDVQLTRDLVPVLHHDHDLLRMTGTPSDITDMNASAVLALPASYPEKFGDQFADNRLITLRDFSAVMKRHPGVTVFVEIKRQSVEVFGADTVAEHVLEAMDSIRQHAVVISFNAEVLHAVRKIDTNLPIGFVLREYDQDHRQQAEELAPAYLFCSTNRIPDDRQVWPGNWQWVLYNTDTVDEALEFYKHGFHMLETNRIVDLLANPELNSMNTLTTNQSGIGTVDPKYGSAGNVNSANQSATTVKPHYDVLVIGGGIHGVGVAQAAAADGYSVAVLEKSRLAEGTSSRSSKLIHGGLRYLESFEISLVWESLRERELLFKLAPDLVRRQTFFIPVYDRTSRKPWMMKLGLLVYSILAGGHKNTRFRTVPKSEWNSLDGIDQTGLKKVLQYWDGQTDDAALTRAVMQSAQDMGADLFYPARFQQADVASDGVTVTFELGGQPVATKASVIINAAGPWANEVLLRVTPAMKPFAVDNIQGAHIECPGTLDKGCYYVEAKDKRVVFVMPWKGHTMIGTTEAKFDDDPDKVAALDEEVAYLKEVYETHFPDRDSTVINHWAGLRVLPAASGAAFKRSRETQLPVDDDTTPRVLSIFGGKLTGYRATGEKVMKILRRTLPQTSPVSSTRELKLKDPAS
ncbi:MAG: FAD-dependent oxidoreductase [Pirellulaceae bacterium]